MWELGVNPRVWAGPHEVHHRIPDANLLPIIETADYLEYRANHPEIKHPPIHELFEGLDPVAILTPIEIRAIGAAARTLVEGRYDAPTSYSKKEARRLLDPKTPRYFYSDPPKFFDRLRDRQKPEVLKPQTEDRSLKRLTPELRDPYSPALHPDGVRGILKDNVACYKVAAEYYKDPANRPERLRQERSNSILNKPGVGPTVFIAANILLAQIVFRKHENMTPWKRALLGSAMAGAAMAGLVAGGNITNSIGHGGDNPFKALFGKNGSKAKPKIDGTFETNAELLSLPTCDEVGGQEWHHNHPEYIAYSGQTGLKKIRQAPFGSMLDFMARHNILMKPGKNFGLKPGEPRPDEPCEAVRMLQMARVRTMKSQGSASATAQ